MDPSSPIRRGVVGELFWQLSEPVLIVSKQGRLDAANPAAEKLLGGEGSAEGLNVDDVAAALKFSASEFRVAISTVRESIIESPERTYSILSFDVSERMGVILRDVTQEREYVARLRSLNQIAREVLSESSVDVVLQSIVDAAKQMTKSTFSALLLLKEGSDTETSKFVYNAPRELFPDRLPRAVGLLAVPIQTKAPARLDDIRGHEAGVGIPVKHPPIRALLAVPIIDDDVVLGELAVANTPQLPTFTEADEAILVELGLHATHAIRSAQRREEVIAQDESQQAMLDMLRHDMMTPITTAKGALELLQNRGGRLTPEQSEALFQALIRAVDNVERLARNLRSDAHLESPRLSRDFSSIEVVELIEELGRDLQDSATARDVSLSIRAEADSPLRFDGAYLLVRQALENLLTNAIKFSPSGSGVVLTSRREGESVRFDVSDEGPGIPIEEQSRLFMRFERQDDSDTSRHGLGLGLSIVRRVAEAHEGGVGLASRPGQGATFWVSFPIRSPLRDGNPEASLR